jgi:CheY-like chemotaxis protein
MSTPTLDILFVDDNASSLPVYERYAGGMLGHRIDLANTATEAWRLAKGRLYDVIVCDAKLPYRNSPLGGLILAEELAARYGRDSVLVVSQFIDEHDSVTEAAGLPFLKKPAAVSHAEWFADVLSGRLKRMKARQFGFAAMPFGCPELNSLFRGEIKAACRDAGHRVMRTDEAPLTRNIVNEIFSMIDDAHFVIFMTADDNPNVFYEAGYALARQKEILMCAPTLDTLPFDVRSNVCLEYRNRHAEFQALVALARGKREEATPG